MRVEKVFFGTPTHGTPRIEWVIAENAMRAYEEHKGSQGGRMVLGGLRIEKGSYIAKNRNEIVRHMYQNGCDATLMVDHDVWFAPQLCEQMVGIMEKTEVGVVAANLALNLNAPSTGYMDDPGDAHRFKHVKQAPKQKAAMVERIASAVCLVHRRVYDAISRHEEDGKRGAPWFGPGTWWMHWPIWDEKDQSWREWGEDISFSHRARTVGERLLLVFDLDITHYKVVALRAPDPHKEEKA